MNRREHKHLAQWVWDCYESVRDPAKLKESLDEFPELLLPHRQDESILSWAVLSGDHTAIALLLEHDFPVQAGSGCPSAYLKSAVDSLDIRTVEIVLGWGLPLDEHDDGFPPLHSAIEYGRIDIARLLLQSGAGVSARGQCDFTPLHLAAARGRADAVELLLSHDAPLGERDEFGETALEIAVRTGNDAIARRLRPG